MKETHVNYELGIKLKEIGFDWVVNSVYWSEQPKTVSFLEYYLGDGSGVTKNSTIQDDFFATTTQPTCAAPTLALAQKFFREVHNIQVFVVPHTISKEGLYYEVAIGGTTYSGFSTYEEALEKGLIHACKLVKQ